MKSSSFSCMEFMWTTSAALFQHIPSTSLLGGSGATHRRWFVCANLSRLGCAISSSLEYTKKAYRLSVLLSSTYKTFPKLGAYRCFDSNDHSAMILEGNGRQDLEPATPADWSSKMVEFSGTLPGGAEITHFSLDMVERLKNRVTAKESTIALASLLITLFQLSKAGHIPNLWSCQGVTGCFTRTAWSRFCGYLSIL